MCAARGGAGALAEASGGAGGPVPLPPRVDRRGFRLARENRQILGNHALSAELTLLGVEASLRSPGPRVARDLRVAPSDQQLLQQLWTLSLPRKTDPARHSEGAARRAGPRL